MRQLGNTALTIAAVTALTISALAQQSNATPENSMPGCHKDPVDDGKDSQITNGIEAAKISMIRAKMPAALDEAEEALKRMNDHGNKCKGMMEKCTAKAA